MSARQLLQLAPAIAAAGFGLMFSAPASAAPPYPTQITPGVLRGIAYDPGDPWVMGYWEYLPSNYESVPADHRYPLLVSLGGIGTFDNPSNCPGNADTCAFMGCNGDGLCRAFRRGPGVEINAGVWDDVARPFITITPQNLATTSSTADFDPLDVDGLISYVVANYPVDPRRIYMLGNSQGGRGVLHYVEAYPRRLAAATVGPAGGVDPEASCRFQDTAFWALHGENDADQNLGVGVFDPCVMVEYVEKYNSPELYPQFPACVARVGSTYPTARMTMFEGVAHNAWTPAFENVATGFANTEWTMDEMCNSTVQFREYAANLDADGVYTWMLGYDRPDTQAPDDFSVAYNATDFTITAATEDDDAITYTWTQTGGPMVMLTNDDQEMVTVTGFSPGQSLTFEVLAVDADNQWDVDDVVVTIDTEPVTGSTGAASGGSSSGGDDGTGGSTTAVDPSSSTTGDATGGPGTSGPGTTGNPTSGAPTSSTPTSASGPDSGGTESSGTDGGGTGTDSGSAGADSDDDSGCSCRTRPDDGPWAWLAVLALLRVRGRGRRTAGRPRRPLR